MKGGYAHVQRIIQQTVHRMVVLENFQTLRSMGRTLGIGYIRNNGVDAVIFFSWKPCAPHAYNIMKGE